MSKFQVGDVLIKKGVENEGLAVTVKAVDTDRYHTTYWVKSHLDGKYFSWKQRTLDNCGWVKKPEWEEVPNGEVIGVVDNTGIYDTMCFFHKGEPIISNPNFKFTYKVERRVK